MRVRLGYGFPRVLLVFMERVELEEVPRTQALVVRVALGLMVAEVLEGVEVLQVVQVEQAEMV